MARLPISGSDDGTWGDVLNEYLSVAHDGNGTLKANAIDSASLQDGIVTDAKLATGSGLDGQVLVKNSGVSGGISWATTDTPDATTSTKGVIQLAGDLSGTADVPTVPALADKEDTTEKGVANGYAPLDSTAKLPRLNLPLNPLGGSSCIQPYLLEDSVSSTAPSSTNVYIISLVADKTITVSGFRAAITTAMAGGTLFRLGLYTVASDDNMTLVARSSGNIADAGSTGLVSVAFNTTGGYPANYQLVTEQKYGLGVCQVGATTAPQLRRKDIGFTLTNGNSAYAFRRATIIGGASECPLTVPANASWSNQLIWLAVA